jgi:hypothetical protein
MDLEQEALIYLIRAISRFHDAYGVERKTETMQDFFATARLDVD